MWVKSCGTKTSSCFVLVFFPPCSCISYDMSVAYQVGWK